MAYRFVRGWLGILAIATALRAEPPKAPVLERYDTSCLVPLALTTRLPSKFWTREKVLEGIQALLPHREEVCLLNKVLLNDRSDRTARILEKVFGVPVSGAQLVIASRSFFDGWPEAIGEAGKKQELGYEDLEVLYGTRVWTEKRLIAAIRLLHGMGIDIGTTAMGHDTRPNVALILTNAFGFRHPDGKIDPIGGQALYGAAQKHFGSWPLALKAAGYDPNRWNRRGTWTEQRIINAIKDMHEAGTPLNIWSVMRDTSPGTLALIKRAAKFPSSGNALTQAAVRRFGSWDNALLAAGLKPHEIRKYKSSQLGDKPTGQLEFWERPGDVKGGGVLLGRPSTDPSEQAAAQELGVILGNMTSGMNTAQRTLTLEVLEIVMTSDNYSTPGSISKALKERGFTVSAEGVQEILDRFRDLAPGSLKRDLQDRDDD